MKSKIEYLEQLFLNGLHVFPGSYLVIYDVNDNPVYRFDILRELQIEKLGIQGYEFQEPEPMDFSEAFRLLKKGNSIRSRPLHRSDEFIYLFSPDVCHPFRKSSLLDEEYESVPFNFSFKELNADDWEIVER